MTGRGLWTVAGVAIIGVGLLIVGSGCGGGSEMLTAAVPPTPTRTSPLGPSPTPRENENLFGSIHAGGGALTVDALPSVDVFFSSCLGGSGDTCEGGTAIYIGTEPGFKEAEDDEPSVPLFQLVDGTPLSLEVTAIDSAVRLNLGDVILSAVGQTVFIGTTPGIHQDLEWQLVVPPGSSANGHSVSVKLTTSSSTYTQSVAYTFELVPAAGPPPEEDE